MLTNIYRYIHIYSKIIHYLLRSIVDTFQKRKGRCSNHLNADDISVMIGHCGAADCTVDAVFADELNLL